MEEEREEEKQDEELEDLDLGEEEAEDVKGGRASNTIGGH